MTAVDIVGNQPVIKDEKSVVVTDSEGSHPSEMSVLYFTAKRGQAEEIPIDCELVVTTSRSERSLLRNSDSDNAVEGPSTLTIASAQTSLSDRKLKDRMRKRQLRQSAEYRQQETVRSRNRMKMRRSDPTYRKKERERDRDRRRLARTNNPEKRAVERERDRLYKKRLREDNPNIDFVVNGVSHEIILIDNSCVSNAITTGEEAVSQGS